MTSQYFKQHNVGNDYTILKKDDLSGKETAWTLIWFGFLNFGLQGSMF